MNFKQYHFYWKSFSELSSIELYDLLNLRQQVFVEEQECAYIDADYSDQHSDHLLAYDGSQLVGYLRIVKPNFKMNDGKQYSGPSIGRIVNHTSKRNEGLGFNLINEAIKKCNQIYPNQVISISAQHRLQDYYERFGFSAVGDVYLEDGIDHIKMTLKSELKYSFSEKVSNILKTRNVYLFGGLLISGYLILNTFIKDINEDAFNWVAKIDNTYISKSKFENYLESIGESRKGGLLEKDIDMVLDKLIDEELLIQRAIDLGMLETDSQVRSVIIQKMIESILSEIDNLSYSDQDIKNFYNSNKDFFASSPKLQLVKLSFDKPSLNSAKRAQEYILDGDFVSAKKLARNDVIDLPNALLPATKVREYIGPRLTEIAMQLEPGSVSELITDIDSVHLLILLKKEVSVTQEFNEITEQVRNEFLKREGDKLFLEYLENLRSWYDVTKKQTS